MKSVLLFLALTTSAIANANPTTLKITGNGIVGSNIKMTVSYQATEAGLTCTSISLQDFEVNTNPRIFDDVFNGNLNQTSFQLMVPLKVERYCNGRLISAGLEVQLPGTELASKLGFKGDAVSIEQSNVDITEIQEVSCKKVATSKGIVTSCAGTVIRVGPLNEANILITERQ